RRTGRTDAFASADSPAYVSDISVDLRAKETLDTLLLHAVAGRLLLGHDRRARRSTLRLAHVLDARALDLGDCLVAKPGKMRRECAGVEKGLLVRGLAALQRDDDVRSRNAARMQPDVVSPRGAEGEHVVVPRAAADPDRSPRGRTKAAVRASDPLLLARAHRPPARAAPRLVQDLLHLGARLRLPEARFQALASSQNLAQLLATFLDALRRRKHPAVLLEIALEILLRRKLRAQRDPHRARPFLRVLGGLHPGAPPFDPTDERLEQFAEPPELVGALSPRRLPFELDERALGALSRLCKEACRLSLRLAQLPFPGDRRVMRLDGTGDGEGLGLPRRKSRGPLLSRGRRRSLVDLARAQDARGRAGGDRQAEDSIVGTEQKEIAVPARELGDESPRSLWRLEFEPYHAIAGDGLQ